MTTDYDAIRAEIMALCKVPLVLGKPEPVSLGEYAPRRSGSKDGSPLTLRFRTPFEVAGYKGSYTGPVDGASYYRPEQRAFGGAARGEFSIGADWYARPVRNPAPAIGDVLSCLLQDAQAGSETFEEFCSSLGYDSDSRKAEATWRECQSCLGAMVRAFGDDLGKATELAYQL